VFRLHLENVPWDAVSTAAGKTIARNREEQQYQGLMKARINYAICLGAILKMYPGMLSVQLLGRLLPEKEQSSKTRDSWTTCLLCHVFRRHLENVPWDAVSTTAGKAE
jgi:hypothetical protein